MEFVIESYEKVVFACAFSSPWAPSASLCRHTALDIGANSSVSVSNRPQSDKESVKLLTVKTISHESGKFPFGEKTGG